MYLLSDNGLLFLAPDEVQIARIDKQAGALAENENQVLPVNRIRAQGKPAADAEIPECVRNNAIPGFFRGDPLHDKAHGEHGLTKKAYDNPHGFRGEICSHF